MISIINAIVVAAAVVSAPTGQIIVWHFADRAAATTDDGAFDEYATFAEPALREVREAHPEIGIRFTKSRVVKAFGRTVRIPEKRNYFGFVLCRPGKRPVLIDGLAIPAEFACSSAVFFGWQTPPNCVKPPPN